MRRVVFTLKKADNREEIATGSFERIICRFFLFCFSWSFRSLLKWFLELQRRNLRLSSAGPNLEEPAKVVWSLTSRFSLHQHRRFPANLLLHFRRFFLLLLLNLTSLSRRLNLKNETKFNISQKPDGKRAYPSGAGISSSELSDSSSENSSFSSKIKSGGVNGRAFNSSGLFFTPIFIFS